MTGYHIIQTDIFKNQVGKKERQNKNYQINGNNNSSRQVSQIVNIQTQIQVGIIFRKQCGIYFYKWTTQIRWV
jgi:hypothetical protein